MAKLPCFAFHACQSAPLPPEGELSPVPYLPPMLLFQRKLRGAGAEEGGGASEREEKRERKRLREQEAGACAKGAGARKRQALLAEGRTHRRSVTTEPGSACAMALAPASPMLLFTNLREAAAEEGVSVREQKEEYE